MQKPRPRDNGFTLVEILVTLFIFGVIAGTLFTAYRALFFDTERFKQTTRNYARAQVAVQRIMADLLAIRVTLPPTHTPPQGDDPPDPLRLTGQTEPAGDEAFSTLRFASAAHVPLGDQPRTGIAAIRYYLEETAERIFVLRRSDQLYPFATDATSGNDPILCEAVQSFRLTYYDQDGEAHDQWDSDSAVAKFATPAAIEFELKIGDTPDTVVFTTRLKLPVHREASANL